MSAQPASISKAYIKSLAKEIGVQRISKDTYPVIQTLVETYTAYILKESFEFTRHRKASTLTEADINAAVKRTV